MRRHISSLIILSFARMRSARVFVLIWNLPARVLPQMKVKPRKLKVSGLPSPRRWRRSAAKRPNSISRVFSGGSDSANFPNRSRSEGKAQEVEGLRLAKPAPLAAFRREASELDQPGLLGVQRQRKLPQPLAI